ncbi:MAG: hypothetical protein ACKVZH_08055 [Blastocatellia bacterium]
MRTTHKLITSLACAARLSALLVSFASVLAFAAMAQTQSSKSTVKEVSAAKAAPVPGAQYPASAEVSDQKAGSILLFPIYISDASSPSDQNARINITNTSSSDDATLHIFAVDSGCQVLDVFLCLTANQTVSLLASDFDPGSSGHIVAVAVDKTTGLPKMFNELIGDVYVKFSSGHRANLAAFSIAALVPNPGGTNPNVTTAFLPFDGITYNRMPRVVAIDNIPSPNDGNSMMLIVNRLSGHYSFGGVPVGSITGLLYNEDEIGFSFTGFMGCQFRVTLSNSFPRTFTPYTRVIPAGRTGWMKFWTLDESSGVFGSAINFNPNTSSSAGAFNQGHNLHALALTDKAAIIIPIFIPTC